jgi:hypothetical protein
LVKLGGNDLRRWIRQQEGFSRSCARAAELSEASEGRAAGAANVQAGMGARVAEQQGAAVGAGLMRDWCGVGGERRGGCGARASGDERWVEEVTSGVSEARQSTTSSRRQTDQVAVGDGVAQGVQDLLRVGVRPAAGCSGRKRRAATHVQMVADIR